MGNRTSGSIDKKTGIGLILGAILIISGLAVDGLQILVSLLHFLPYIGSIASISLALVLDIAFVFYVLLVLFLTGHMVGFAGIILLIFLILELIPGLQTPPWWTLSMVGIIRVSHTGMIGLPFAKTIKKFIGRNRSDISTHKDGLDDAQPKKAKVESMTTKKDSKLSAAPAQNTARPEINKKETNKQNTLNLQQKTQPEPPNHLNLAKNPNSLTDRTNNQLNSIRESKAYTPHERWNELKKVEHSLKLEAVKVRNELSFPHSPSEVEAYHNKLREIDSLLHSANQSVKESHDNALKKAGALRLIGISKEGKPLFTHDKTDKEAGEL